jgi:hypothetical protein
VDYQDSVIITAKLNRVEELENLGLQQVYDLTIEDQHEYFANNLLVHNCRYAVYNHSKQITRTPFYIG